MKDHGLIQFHMHLVSKEKFSGRHKKVNQLRDEFSAVVAAGVIQDLMGGHKLVWMGGGGDVHTYIQGSDVCVCVCVCVCVWYVHVCLRVCACVRARECV